MELKVVMEKANRIIELTKTINECQAEIENIMGSVIPFTGNEQSEIRLKKRRKMSGWARRRISKAMKKRWATLPPEKRRIWAEKVGRNVHGRIDQ